MEGEEGPYVHMTAQLARREGRTTFKFLRLDFEKFNEK